MLINQELNEKTSVSLLLPFYLLISDLNEEPPHFPYRACALPKPENTDVYQFIHKPINLTRGHAKYEHNILTKPTAQGSLDRLDSLQSERSSRSQPEVVPGPRSDSRGRQGVPGLASRSSGLHLGVGDLPTTKQEQRQSTNNEHTSNEDLGGEEVAERRGAPSELHGDGLGEGSGDHEREEDRAQDAAELDEPRHLGQHGAHRAPERAHRHADQQRERDEHPVAVRGDPEREDQERADPRHRHGHVDPPHLVAVVPDDGPPDPEAEVEHGLDDGALVRVQPDRRGVRGQTVKQGNVTKLGHEAPTHDEQDLDASEMARIERTSS